MLPAHEVLGSGPLTVAIHGITESRKITRPLTEALAANRTVLAVDLRGRGESALGDTCRMEEAATDIHETLVAVGFTDADLALFGSDPGPSYADWLASYGSVASTAVWADHGHYPPSGQSPSVREPGERLRPGLRLARWRHPDVR